MKNRLNISVLGSTGSIGCQALEVIESLGKYKIKALSAHKNIELLEEQVNVFKPEYVAVADEEKADILNDRIDIEVLKGSEGLNKIAADQDNDTLLNSLVGFSGLIPTITALKNKTQVALANKESMVCGGAIISGLAKDNDTNILPIDSEHSAIFQCLHGERIQDAAKIYLTCSGGPLQNKSAEELKNITVEEALNHPNWSMGKKITVDSATLMNKGLEVIEARWLFDMDYDKINVVIHPQSIIHSMIEFIDGSIKAQLGPHDMKLPIQYALTYPERNKCPILPFDFTRISNLSFSEPDYSRFPCLEHAFTAGIDGGVKPTILNAANEIAVDRFLNEKITFDLIPRVVRYTMESIPNIQKPSIDDIMNADTKARKIAIDYLAE